MNFNICKKCLGYSLKNKIKGGAIYSYDKDSTTIGFYLKNRQHESVKITLKTSPVIQNILFSNIDIYNDKTFQKLDLETFLKNVEVMSCSETIAREERYRPINFKICPYYIEHMMDDWN